MAGMFDDIPDTSSAAPAGGGGGGGLFDDIPGPSTTPQAPGGPGGAEGLIHEQNAAARAAMEARATQPTQSFHDRLVSGLREAGKKIQHGVDVLQGETEAYGPPMPGQKYVPGPAPTPLKTEDVPSLRNLGATTGARPLGAPKPGETLSGPDQ